MQSHSDFKDGQRSESGSSAPDDFYEHVARQNKRDEDSRAVNVAPKERLRASSCSETCERCGRILVRVLIWNGKRLCKGCVEAEQGAWELYSGGPDAPAQRVPAQSLNKAKERSRIDSLVSDFLALFGLKIIEKEIIAAAPGIPLKLMDMLAVRRPDRKQMPEAEGIMDINKRKNRSCPRRNSAGIRSFPCLPRFQ